MTDVMALLIGADGYLPNHLPDGSSYGPLSGCVRDIARVEAFLTQKVGVLDERILRLVASNTGQPQPPEPRDLWPTYEHVVAAFRRLTDMAQAGDQVYIHYSGHGGRTPTRFPDLKGADGLDECLVPIDIGSSTARYVRDMELAHLLRVMVEKGLIVTVVLDSCHSGGATRGTGDAAVRGLGVVDRTPRPAASLVAADEVLAETWRLLTESVPRGLTLGSDWLPEPKGYVLLAACRPSEKAYEYAIDGQHPMGVLTYWLLDALRHLGPRFTYKLLHDRVVANVHGQFERQTPQLYGEASRLVFGAARLQAAYAVTVLRTDAAGSRVLLNTGFAQGVRRGVQFAVHPAGTTDFMHGETRLAIVRLVDVGATESWADIVEWLTGAVIEPGAQAIPVEAGAVRLRRTVRLEAPPHLGPVVDQSRDLESVRAAIGQEGHGWVALAEEGETADFRVAIRTDGAYEIQDPAGLPVPNLRPPILVADSDGAERLVRRLVHLSRYQAVLQLDNYDTYSPLAGKLTAELFRAQAGYEPGDRPAPRPFEEPGNTPTLAVGDWVLLRVRNDSTEVLNTVVLDLEPGWGISQVHPARGDTDFMPLDPGREEWLPFQAHLPDGYVDGTDILKVLASVGTASFRWLELPPLNEPPARGVQGRGGPKNGLEQLLADTAAERPATRELKPAAYPSWEWTTAQVEVRISRARPASG